MRDRKLLAALLCSLGVAAAAPFASAALAQNETQPEASSRASGIDGTIFHAQVLLDRAGFAPGVIDGKKGMSFREAVKGFQTSRGLDVTGVLDTPTRQALLTDQAPSTRRLRIDESDAQGPFVGSIPDDPVEQAKMERLGYRNLLEKIAEKFHTTPATIIALNRPDMVLRAGTVLRLPNVLPSSRDYGDVPAEAAQMLSDLNVGGNLPEAERIVVDKSDGVLRLYGEGDRLLAQFPATMGSERDPLPLGNWQGTSIGCRPGPTGRWASSGSTSPRKITASTAPAPPRRSSGLRAMAASASPIGTRRVSVRWPATACP